MTKIPQFFFLLFSILAFSSCVPSKPRLNLEVNTSKISFLTESDAECELKLKSYIEKHSLKFVDTIHLSSEANQANQIKIENAEEKLTIREQKNQVIEYQHITNFKTKDVSGEKTTSLGLNEKGSFYLMYLEASLKVRTDREVKTFSQRYGIKSKSCQLELIKSSLIGFTNLGNQSFSFKELSISNTNEILSEKHETFKINKEQELSEFTEDITTYNQIFNHPNIVVFVPDAGIIELRIQPSNEFQLPILGDLFNFKSVQAKGIKNNIELFTLTLGFDEAQQVSYNNTMGTISYTLQFNKFFTKVRLGDEYNSIGSQKSSLDYDYQTHNSKINLISNKKINYTSFAGYWKVLTEKIDETSKVYKYSLEENPKPEFFSKTTNNDLASNSTIQVDLPEINEIANKIKEKAGSDRKKIIQGILGYLASNYSYDYDMLNKNIVRPLTAKEALDRKKGVCQHYSVLFTTIARALKVPSRITWGYLINGKKVGSHAWVEVEIDENLWRVVEPQSANGLTDTLTRFYFPLARATFLEDKAQFSPEIFDILISNKYEFLMFNEIH